MTTGTYPINGIPVTPGATIPTRRELSEWSISSAPQDRIQVSLFIRAAEIMQNRDPRTDQFSYARVGGIHNAPFQSWDGAPVDGKGYCHHNDYLFPTWHRPYMNVYEQILHTIMVNELIPKIQDPAVQQTWKAAADLWRLPFWDWAVVQQDTGKLGMPRIVSDASVTILELGGTESVDYVNPLYKFVNRLTIDGKLTEVPMGDERMGEYKIKYTNARDVSFGSAIGTSRWADPANKAEWVEGSVNNNLANDAFATPNWGGPERTGTIAENVARILNSEYWKSYDPFASKLYREEHEIEATEWLSLEMIHDRVHVWIGGFSDQGDNGPRFDGHMANVAVAGFDPIFFMHHCNIDRLLSIWQFLNPGKWVGEDRLYEKLYPFHTDSTGGTHDSQTVKDIAHFGYTYPELREGATQESVTARIRELYGAPIDKLQVHRGFGVTEDSFQDYIINVKYDRYALDGEPYVITFSLRDTENRWSLGNVFTFSSPLELGCGNCQAQKRAGVLSKGQVPITALIYTLFREYGWEIRLNAPPSALVTPELNLDPHSMGPFLEKLLQWKVTKTSGEVVPPEQLRDLEVTVLTNRAKFPSSNRGLPKFNADGYRPLYAATHGKFGGARDPSR